MSTEKRFSAEDVASILRGIDNDLCEDVGKNGVFASIRTVHHYDEDTNQDFLVGLEVDISDAQDGHTETFSLRIQRES